MGQRTLDGVDLTALRTAYARRLDDRLPAVAARRDGWPIHAGHCFERVVLDNLFRDEWYDHVEGRPARRHLAATQLRRAIDLADRMLDEGRPAVVELNARSLRWRGV
jgi:hypothetical protein